MSSERRQGLSAELRVGETLNLTVHGADASEEAIAITLDVKAGTGKAGQTARFRIQASDRVRIMWPTKRSKVLEAG